TDAARARRAVDRLAREPETAVALLGERFKAPPVPANADVSALIRGLDSEAFAERERASHQLRGLGLKAESARREALKGATPEAKRRIEKVLEALDAAQQLPITDTEALRGVRAIEFLERARTPAAKTLLQSWADQSTEPRQATEARLAVERLRLLDSYPYTKPLAKIPKVAGFSWVLAVAFPPTRITPSAAQCEAGKAYIRNQAHAGWNNFPD